MMLLRNIFRYHLRKPRVQTQTDISYNAYKATLKQARKAIHKEAVQYLNQIEDAYLDQHHQEMKNKHFEYQCNFRKQIFTDAFRLHQNQLRWQKKDEDYNAVLNKHLHDEDIKKINRSRIIKIMEHESSNYWFNADNVDERLQDETIFPEYIASSEYYYKLYAEALAYQTGDFKELHAVSSNEEMIREKNKFLIPLFLTLRNKIANFKKDEAKEARQRNIFELNLVKTNPNLSSEQVEELTNKLNANLQKQLQQLEAKKEKLGKLTMLKLKIKDIISIFKTWKQYTNVLALTSAQILKNRSDVTGQLEIQKTEKEVLKNLSSKLHETFIDSIEEDTEQVDMSFEEYLAKINENRKERQVEAGQSINTEDLDALLRDSESGHQEQSDKLSLNKDQSEYSKLAQKVGPQALKMEEVTVQEEEINPLFLNQRETTATVQILKQHYKGDRQMMVLLNQLGQIDVRYPKLFENIWQSIR